MEDKKVLDPVIAVIEKALDGRSYRWLAMEIKMPETELSKRMNGHTTFSTEELTTIHARLNANLIEKIPIIQE